MKLIHLTDTHLVQPGRTLYGLDPQARLAAAIADIQMNHGDAELVVVTGDLTHWGEPEAYGAFCEGMSGCRIPYVAMVGNHDKRSACLEGVAAAPRDSNGFVQGVRDVRAGRLIFLDTLDETTHAGVLCETRLAWLGETLAQAPKDQPLYIFMHHPPFKVGMPSTDIISLREPQRFAAVIAPYVSRIRHMFLGHVHRPISGSWRGIPFSILPATVHQSAFVLDAHGPDLASHEPPAYGVVLIDADSVVVHTHSFLDDSVRFQFHKAGVEDRTWVLGPVVPYQT